MPGIFDRQAAKQQAVHDAEDGGVGADGEGQGEDGDHGRAELAAQQAGGEAKVLCTGDEKCADRHDSAPPFLYSGEWSHGRRSGGETVRSRLLFSNLRTAPRWG